MAAAFISEVFSGRRTFAPLAVFLLAVSMWTAGASLFRRRLYSSSSSTTGQWSLPITSLQMSAFLILSFSRSDTMK